MNLGVLALCSCVLALGPPARALERRTAQYPLASVLEGPQSPFGRAFLRLLTHLPDTKPHASAADPVQVVGIKTPGDDFYFAYEKTMVIAAPLAAVEAILDGYDHYREMFPDFSSIGVLSRDANKTVVAWERPAPVFFVPNIRYQFTYLKATQHGRVIYRMQLKESNTLDFSDGLIVLTGDGATTSYRSYDSYKARLGVAAIVGSGRIWRDSLRGTYVSDMAIKFHAEHPDWSADRVQAAARLGADQISEESVPYLELKDGRF